VLKATGYLITAVLGIMASGQAVASAEPNMPQAGSGVGMCASLNMPIVAIARLQPTKVEPPTAHSSDNRGPTEEAKEAVCTHAEAWCHEQYDRQGGCSSWEGRYVGIKRVRLPNGRTMRGWLFDEIIRGYIIIEERDDCGRLVKRKILQTQQRAVIIFKTGQIFIQRKAGIAQVQPWPVPVPIPGRLPGTKPDPCG
jgi:hypothetical protein